jgi:spore coat protein A
MTVSLPGKPTRREFIRVGAFTGGGLYLAAQLGGVRRVFALSIPGGTLAPCDIPRFVTPLLVPPVMPKAATLLSRGGRPTDYYEISMRQFTQQILPAGFPTTTVWGYGPVNRSRSRGLLLHNAPSLTIEAQWNRPVRVKWINELVDSTGKYLHHLLPVDPTLHWANPGGGLTGRDSRPEFDTTPDSYTGPVPMVTHVHGAAGVGDESDGYAEAWYLPDAVDITGDVAREGTWYDFFRGKANDKFGVIWEPGSAICQYPNAGRAATLWYHDHTLGMTRLNVYAGPAGFYMVRGGPSGDKAVLDSRTGASAVLPGPAPMEGDRFPSNKKYCEIPIAIQDRAFNQDGSLFYPDTRAFFDEFEGPFIPRTDVPPVWNPEFFGNCLMVNGNTWPYLDVEQRRYRFRVLNGCQSRFLILDFTGIEGVRAWQIGNEAGFLAAPVNVTDTLNGQLLLGPAERADLIVDFADVPAGSYVLGNIGPDEPFGGGVAGEDFDPADAGSTGQVLQFNVYPAAVLDPTTPPEFLQLPPVEPLPVPARTRRLVLLEEMSKTPGFDGPVAAVLGTVDEHGRPEHRMWDDPVTENPAAGDTEVWELYNLTADAHPMHVHEVTFEVVNRERLVMEHEGTHMEGGSLELSGDIRPPEPTETGRKDTVIAYPGEVTRIKATFSTAGQYVWHCHIVEHEDNEMMRPFRVGPAQPGEPE